MALIRENSSADELLDTIHATVDRLVRDGPEETRHDRANLGNDIVMCASVLWTRLGRAERQLSEVTSTPRTPLAEQPGS